MSNKESFLQQALELTEALEILPASMTTIRSRLQKQRSLLLGKARRPGNPAGNIGSIEHYKFRQKGTEPLSRTLTFRVTESQYQAWQDDRTAYTEKFRGLLG